MSCFSLYSAPDWEASVLTGSMIGQFSHHNVVARINLPCPFRDSHSVQRAWDSGRICTSLW